MRIEMLLENSRTPVHLHRFEETDSTNTRAMAMLKAGAAAPLAVLAEKQTAGRGRHGRTWHSADRDNLYLSFGFRPNLPPEQLQRFTLWMGLAFCRYLNHEHGLPVQIKWPNDLIHRGRKVAGMLSEARIEEGLLRELVFGIGLNINASTRDWPEHLQQSATSLRAVAGSPQPLDFDEISAGIIEAGVRAADSYFNGAYAGVFDAQWAEFDGLKGKRVALHPKLPTGEFPNPEGAIAGVSIGLSSDGALLLQTDDGRISAFHVGDVSLREVAL